MIRLLQFLMLIFLHVIIQSCSPQPRDSSYDSLIGSKKSVALISSQKIVINSILTNHFIDLNPEMTNNCELVNFSIDQFTSEPTSQFIAFSANCKNQEGFLSYRQIFLYNLLSDTTITLSKNEKSAFAKSDATLLDSSQDGLSVIFSCTSCNLIEGQIQGAENIYHYSSLTQKLQMIPLQYPQVLSPKLTDDGNWLYYLDKCSGVDSANSNKCLHRMQLQTKQTTQIFPKSFGQLLNGTINNFDLSANGNQLVFETTATNLRADLEDKNNSMDLYHLDQSTSILTLVSTNQNKTPNAASYAPVLSKDGRLVYFSSKATNLSEMDRNSDVDIFLFDVKDKTVRHQIDGQTYEPHPAISIIENAKIILFQTEKNIGVDQNFSYDIYAIDESKTINWLSSFNSGVDFLLKK